MIPQMAIHMNREVNKGYAWNCYRPIWPLSLDGRKAAGTFRCQIAEAAGVQAQDILSMESLFSTAAHREPSGEPTATYRIRSAPGRSAMRVRTPARIPAGRATEENPGLRFVRQ